MRCSCESEEVRQIVVLSAVKSRGIIPIGEVMKAISAQYWRLRACIGYTSDWISRSTRGQRLVTAQLVTTSLLMLASREHAAPSTKPARSADSRALFAAADRNADGSVSFAEFATLARESVVHRIAARFRQLDRNRDGRCTRAEVNKMPADRFARFDLDRDGAFTAAELTTLMLQRLDVRLARLYPRIG